jgi:hypothetical protein
MNRIQELESEIKALQIALCGVMIGTTIGIFSLAMRSCQ